MPLSKLNLKTSLKNYPVQINQNERIKHLSLRLSDNKELLILNLPKKFELSLVKKFLEKARQWVEKQEVSYKTFSSLKPGIQIELLDEIYTLEHQTSYVKKVICQDKKIIVFGKVDDFETCVRFYFEKKLKEEIVKIVDEYIKVLKVSYNKITIKDTKTRYGSCSSLKNLNFNWRLIFAPSKYLAYVCAHEVCHLLEMNHSSKFWAHVESIYPDYKEAKKWFNQHNKDLFAFG